MSSTFTSSQETDHLSPVAVLQASHPDSASIEVPCEVGGKSQSMTPDGASQRQLQGPADVAAAKSKLPVSAASSSALPHSHGASSSVDQSRKGDGASDDTPISHLSCPAASLDRPRDDEFDALERRARVVLETIGTQGGVQGSNLGEHVEVLQSYRTGCQERAMYREAYLVHQLLRNLRLEEETRHLRGITEKQMEERRMLEEAHREEFRQFHHSWNARIDAFEEEQLEAEMALLERQNEELIRFQEEMREFQPRVLKYSRSLIESRLKQQTLAKQQDYVKAEAERVNAEAIEAADMERFQATRRDMYERREYASRHRHQQELFALRSKIESRRLYLERYRKQELDVLLQRYINSRRSMELQQNIVRNKTGTLLLKHACNMKTDNSGTAVLVECAESGTFGSSVQRRSVSRAPRVIGPIEQGGRGVSPGGQSVERA
ncbi:hypothetical protein JKF63_00703 [Porcisia hertigi]|uniref:Uncharacterized protein n=1 Tax=Porcisia hertigi TaxID=2761500 RepID=A0A836L766_9TRYP|nr:hypothetical protein JKF63_00703 [Porcisia hertigi]